MEIWIYAIICCIVPIQLAFSNITYTSKNSDVTTLPEYLIRRKPAPRSISPGGRLSLINSRFNRRLKPRKKDLDREQLLELLGDYFDPDWMSFEEPAEMSKPNRGSTLVFRRDGWQHVELTEQLRLSNLSTDLSEILNSSGVFKEEVADTKTAVEKYLLKRATCPVRYFWDDIGTGFWPRYVRRGECPRVQGTCSWPPGMHCVASGTSSVHVLRWQCKAAPQPAHPRGSRGNRKSKSHPKKKEWKLGEGDQTSGLRCHWVRVPYPITSNCMCTC